MIFSKIIIERMFSYADRQELDLSGCEPGRNICLIIGRNGFGKTSLLNSLKLLFIGIHDERMRMVGFPPRRLKERDYIAGDGERWSGILNRLAARDHSDCSITAVWHGETGEVRATRRWILEPRNYREEVELQEGKSKLVKDDAAAERLNQLCPPEIVPFFFFDGEQIQALAEDGDERRSQEFDRLLGLTFIEGVLDQLNRIRLNYQRRTLPEEIRAKIVDFETTIQRLEAECQLLQRKLDTLTQGGVELKKQRDALIARRERLRSPGSSQSEKARIEAQISEIETATAGEQRKLAEEMPVLVPLLANPELVHRSLEKLETVINHRLSADVQLMETLSSQLPRVLFETPPYPRPPLTKDQIAFLKERLVKSFQIYVPSDIGEASLSVSAETAEKLRASLLGILESAGHLRASTAERLRMLSNNKRFLEMLRKERLDLDVHEEGDRVLYHKLTTEINDLLGNIEENEREYGRLSRDIERLNQQMKETSQGLAKAKATLPGAEGADRELHVASETLRVLRAIKNHVRTTRRLAVEEALNAHFSVLMGSHQLISYIAINDNLDLWYRDLEGNFIGSTSISHATRQLLATALLWSLKDVSGARIPVVVDMPLARIDTGNQVRILQNFYANISDQVILIVMDSEINGSRSSIIRDRIYSVIRIENQTGQNGRFVQSRLV